MVCRHLKRNEKRREKKRRETTESNDISSCVQFKQIVSLNIDSDSDLLFLAVCLTAVGSILEVNEASARRVATGEVTQTRLSLH